jgi:hypothetical protein
MAVDALPEILAWQPHSTILAEKYRWYVHLLCDFFGQTVRKVKLRDDLCAGRLVESFRGSSSEDLIRVITAPEVANLVLTQDHRDIFEAADQLSDWFLAETIKSGGPTVSDRELWTALGDVALLPDGSRRSFGHTRGIPLDFGSANLRKLNLEGELRADGDEAFLCYDVADAACLRQALDAATTAIRKTNPAADFIVETFTKVVMVARTSQDAHTFMSGTNGGWPGRVLLVNAHAPAVSHEVLADSVVHEAIHGLLFLEQLDKAWADNWDQLSAGTATSPWTGRVLPAGAFLEACFVWYGLANFWTTAFDSDHFDHDEAAALLQFAVGGFRTGPLAEVIAPDLRRLVAADVLDTITELQRRVLDSTSLLPCTP